MKKVKGFLTTVKYDMKVISGIKEKKQVIIYTILLWFCFYLYFYICFFAFDFTKDLGPLAGLIVFAMTNIGVSVPVPGGIGSWHFVVISSLLIQMCIRDRFKQPTFDDLCDYFERVYCRGTGRLLKAEFYR